MSINIAAAVKSSVIVAEPKMPRNKSGWLHIAFGTDAAYARHMGACMTSIILNNPAMELFFHIFTAGLPADDFGRLTELARKHGVGVQVYTLAENAIGLDEIVPGRFSTPANFSFAYYYRLIIPHVVRGATRRILYLDADIICVGKLTELATLELEGKMVAVVSDRADEVGKLAAKFGLPQYFNSGVLYIDVDQWCAAQVSERAIALLNDEAFDTRFHDQDALNVVLAGNTRFIDPKWNLILGKQGDCDTLETVLIHYAGTKPWQKFCRHPLRHYYHDYAALSLWGEVPLADPKTYREMRQYIKILVAEGKVFPALHWLVPYIQQRRKEKVAAGNIQLSHEREW